MQNAKKIHRYEQVETFICDISFVWNSRTHGDLPYTSFLATAVDVLDSYGVKIIVGSDARTIPPFGRCATSVKSSQKSFGDLCT